MGCYFNLKTDPERERRWNWISLIEMDGPRASIHSHKHGQCLFSQRRHLLMSPRSRGYAAAACMEWLLFLTSQRRDVPVGRITIASRALECILHFNKTPLPPGGLLPSAALWGPQKTKTKEKKKKKKKASHLWGFVCWVCCETIE